MRCARKPIVPAWRGSAPRASAVAVLVVGALLGPTMAAPEAVSAAAQPATAAATASPSPAPTLPPLQDDDQGEPITTPAIEQRREDTQAIIDQLDRVSRRETATQRRAVVARDRLRAADQAVSTASEAARDAEVEATRASNRADEAEARLRDARAVRDEVVETLAVTEGLLDEAHDQLQKRVRQAFMTGGQLTTSSLVLGMDDVNDVARIRHLLSSVVEADDELVENYLQLQLARQERLDEVTAEEARVAEASTAAETSRDERAEASAAADRAERTARTRRADRATVLREVRTDLRNLGAARLAAEERYDHEVAALESEVEVELERRREAERRRLEEERRRREEAAARAAAEREAAEREVAERVVAEREVAEREAAAAAERQASAVAGLSRAEQQAATLRAAHQARIASGAGGIRPRAGCGSTLAWVWPTDGCVTSPFGYRTHPVLGTRRLHAGIDIPAPQGQPIHAVADGRVHRAGWSTGGHGNVVVIDHGEAFSLYAHQVRLAVRTGQRVVAGQVIGWVGTTGLSTGAHLHFEVHINGAYGTNVDPERWFR